MPQGYIRMILERGKEAVEILDADHAAGFIASGWKVAEEVKTKKKK